MSNQIGVNQKPANQKLTVSYEGKDYEANYSVYDDAIAVEMALGGAFIRKTTTQIGAGRSGRAFSIARMMALDILRSAKQRGELG